MNPPALPLAIAGTGLVASIGLSAPDACAAALAGLLNAASLPVDDAAGIALRGHPLPAEAAAPEAALARLALAAGMAIEECLIGLDEAARQAVPLLLCVAEAGRPGRPAGLDEQLLALTEARLTQRFAPDSVLLPHGRVGVAVALDHARRLIAAGRCTQVLIAGTDSLLGAATLAGFEARGRLRSSLESDGFMPGEAAAAVRVAALQGDGAPGGWVCRGLGFGIEPAPIGSGEPLRADGLTNAIRAALDEAGCTVDALQARIADVSGAQYGFREAGLAMMRLRRSAEVDAALLHPAQFIGECGAASGVAALVFAVGTAGLPTAGPWHTLVHVSDDADKRAALVLARQPAASTHATAGLS